jgi:hypothetical protein
MVGSCRHSCLPLCPLRCPPPAAQNHARPALPHPRLQALDERHALNLPHLGIAAQGGIGRLTCPVRRACQLPGPSSPGASRRVPGSGLPSSAALCLHRCGWRGCSCRALRLLPCRSPLHPGWHPCIVCRQCSVQGCKTYCTGLDTVSAHAVDRARDSPWWWCWSYLRVPAAVDAGAPNEVIMSYDLRQQSACSLHTTWHATMFVTLG